MIWEVGICSVCFVHGKSVALDAEARAYCRGMQQMSRTVQTMHLNASVLDRHFVC